MNTNTWQLMDIITCPCCVLSLKLLACSCWCCCYCRLGCSPIVAASLSCSPAVAAIDGLPTCHCCCCCCRWGCSSVVFTVAEIAHLSLLLLLLSLRLLTCRYCYRSCCSLVIAAVAEIAHLSLRLSLRLLTCQCCCCSCHWGSSFVVDAVAAAAEFAYLLLLPSLTFLTCRCCCCCCRWDCWQHWCDAWCCAAPGRCSRRRTTVPRRRKKRCVRARGKRGRRRPRGRLDRIPRGQTETGGDCWSRRQCGGEHPGGSGGSPTWWPPWRWTCCRRGQYVVPRQQGNLDNATFLVKLCSRKLGRLVFCVKIYLVTLGATTISSYFRG